MTYHFKEPKINLTIGGEFLVKAVSYSAYALAAVSMVFMFLSQIPNLRWGAFLILLFLGDRLLHIKEGEKSIKELERKAKKGKDVNIAETLTPKSYEVMSYAFRKSLAIKSSFHLILLEKLLEYHDVKEALKRLSVDINQFGAKIEEYKEGTGTEPKHELRVKMANLVQDAYNIAEELDEKFIDPRNILVALVGTSHPKIKKLLELFELTPQDVKEAIIFGRHKAAFSKIKKLPSSLGGFAHSYFEPRKRIMNRAWTARPTPFLDRLGSDLTALARKQKAGFLVGHKEEFNSLMNVLSRPSKPNALLVGEPGVGKFTIISHLAFKINKDEVPEILFDKRLVSLEVGSLIADASSEEVAGRLKRIAEEIVMAGNIVLFIPGIENLFKPLGEAEGAIKAMDIFLPIIKNNSIPVIGSTYPRGFKEYIEPNSNFLNQFEDLRIKEISPEEAVRILTYQSLIMEKEYGIFVTFRAVKKSVYLSYRYLHKKPLPACAMDLLKQSFAKSQQEGNKKLDEKTVVETAQGLSRIPIKQAGEEETEQLLNLEQIVHRRLVNQEAAVQAVARSLREYRSGLSRQGGPIATFLFVGPTGVGKTELTKIISRIQFGSKKSMIRFDMSEYQDKQSIFRFIGTPDAKNTGSLTDAILEDPYSLVLLDEFEKAHPDILNLFLQVFDDGRLTDSLGRTVSFENTIIIATSNAHSEFIKQEIEKGREAEAIAEELKKKLTKYFKPELLNRFSDVIVFRSLAMEEIKKITRIMVGEFAKQIQKTHGIKLEISKSAADKIAERGYSPVFGARPLRNTISETIKSPLAEKILRKEVGRGNTLVLGYSESEDFRFEVKE